MSEITNLQTKANLPKKVTEDILKFFNSQCKNNVAIIKLKSNFPKLEIESDIDMVVDDINEFTNDLIKFFTINKHYKLKKTKNLENQVHLDLYENGVFLLKFDIYFNKYESKYFILKNNYFKDLLANKIIKDLIFLDKKYQIPIPNIEFELIVRLFEYKKFPEKKHHKLFFLENYKKVEFIKETIKQYSDLNIFTTLRLPKFLIKKINIIFIFKKRFIKKIINSKKIKSLFLKKYNYKSCNSIEIDTGWSIIESKELVLLPLNKLRINIFKNKLIKSVNIVNSPHFKFLNNFYIENARNDIYRNYLIKSSEKFNNDNVKIYEDKFLNLFKSIKSSDADVFVIIKPTLSLFFLGRAKIIDGAHRATIMKVLDKKNIRCYLINE